MIIFINGAFGIGKSSVAELLVKKLSNSLIFDPEEVGYMLRKIYKPIDNPKDFQDLIAWRELTIKTAEAIKKQYNKNLIMPMCIWNEKYFDEIIPEIKKIDPDFYHFCLVANKETILNRLKGRNDAIEVINWATERVEKCVDAYKLEKFEKKINTENKTIDEVVNEIITYLKV